MKPGPAILLLLTVISTQAASSQPPQFTQPQKEHEWLEKFSGQWTSHAKSIAEGDAPATECTGKMTSRMVGGFWVINELQGEVEGQTFNAIQTIGYDAEKKKYVGTWVDSMMNHLWHYSGELTGDGKKLVLLAEGPNVMAEGKTSQYRDSYEFKSPDLILVTSEMLGEDGKWTLFMESEMKRTQ